MADRKPSAAIHPRVIAELDRALVRAESEVALMAPSAEQRLLRELLCLVWHAKASWADSAPSHEQVEFLSRIVEGVHREASRETPTVRLRRA
jgi:hypothetical protein